MTQRII